MKGERVEGVAPKTVYMIVDEVGDLLIVHAYDDGDAILEMRGKEIWLKPDKVAELRDCLAPDPLRMSK